MFLRSSVFTLDSAGAMESTTAAHSQLTLALKWPLIRPQFINFTSYSTPISRNKTVPLFLAHCSIKPNANKETLTDGHHSTADSPRFQPQANSNSGEAISSNSSSTRGLVFDIGPNDSWDSLEIGSPVVKRYLSDDEERWYMWYHGRSRSNPESDSIGLAVSSNGIHWDRGGQGVRRNVDAGLVLSKSDDWWAFDTHGVRPCEVLIMSSNKVRANSGVYWLYYTGYYSEKIENLVGCLGFSFQNPDRALDSDGKSKILKSLPGLAMSQDGRHWARIEGEHHTGALLDVGTDGEWDSAFIASPQVVFHVAGDIRMYYHSFDAKNGEFGIGVARSRDGMRWVKLGKILGSGGDGAFDEYGTVNPQVVRSRKDGKYLMVYEGVGEDGRRGVGLVVSDDGLKEWQRVAEGPVLERSEEGGWDCEGVGMPCLVEMDGEMEEWRLYYRGIGKGGRTGIGLAVCEGSQVKSFERRSGFQL